MMRHQTSVGRTAAAVLLASLVTVIAGCGGGSDSVTTTGATSTDATTETNTTLGDTTMSTDTTATGTSVNVGETATWRGDAFTVSDVETGDTDPDPLGEKQEAQNGVWLIFTITPADDGSAIWSPDFTENIQIKGGDGVVYDDQDFTHNNAGVQQEFGEGDFLVWIDVPEAAVSGAVLEITDDLDPGVDATRVDLGL
jgi:flagellin-like hook-associated protein FlgL